MFIARQQVHAPHGIVGNLQNVGKRLKNWWARSSSAVVPSSGCAAQLVQLKWNLRVVFVSGYSGAQAIQYQGGPVTDFAFVPKPFSAEELLSKVAPQTKNVSAAGR